MVYEKCGLDRQKKERAEGLWVKILQSTRSKGQTHFVSYCYHLGIYRIAVDSKGKIEVLLYSYLLLGKFPKNT